MKVIPHQTTRYLRTAAAAALLTSVTLAGFFVYLDCWAALEDALYDMNGMAAQLEQRGQPAEAEALYRRIVGNAEPRFGTYPGVLIARNELAMLLMRQGRLLEAQLEFQRLLADASSFRGRSEVLGFDEPDLAWVSSNYGECLLRAGKLQQARAILEAAQAVLVRKPDDVRYARGLRVNNARLRRVYGALGLAPEAARLPAN
jgi:tetratricopeptide (TPR) repeat protein